MSKKCGGFGLNGIQLKWIIGTHSNWRNQNLGSHFGATRKTALPIQPIYGKNWPNGLNWQCWLAGSSKTAPRILISSIAMGADYSFELISIETNALRFIGHNNSFLSGVSKDPLSDGDVAFLLCFWPKEKNVCLNSYYSQNHLWNS